MSEYTYSGLTTPVPALQTTGFFFGRNNLFFQFLTETDAPSLETFLEASPVHPVENVAYRMLEQEVLYKWELF